MKRSYFIVFAITSCLTVLVGFIADAVSEQIRYMDKSGNIKFVDSVAQVPREYVLQVVTPTPKPVYTKQQIDEMRRKEREAGEEKKRQDQQKLLDIKKKDAEMRAQREREERDLRRMDGRRQMQAR